MQKPITAKDWLPKVQPYTGADDKASLRSVLLTLGPLALFTLGALLSLGRLNFLVPLFDLLAALFLVRTFILQHDAGHGSLFRNQRTADRLGAFLGFLTLVPYHAWRQAHARHHATSGNLDARGVGDVYTMTLNEYLAAPWHARLRYRLYRHPLVMFLLGPVWVFMLSYRLPLGYGRARPAVRKSILITNLAVALLYAAFYLLGGLGAVLFVLLPIQYLAGMLGIFLFYVQHQFEETYWENQPRWAYLRAAMEGASFLRLPAPLAWLTGGIGYHHVHHLAPKIPHYRLKAAHEGEPILQVAPTLGLAEALRVAFGDLHLWDEEKRRLTGFSEAARRLRARARRGAGSTSLADRRG